jgi:hypothetical protein
MPPQCRAFLESCPSKDAANQLVELMLLAREVGAERMLGAMDAAMLSGRPTAEIVKLHLGFGRMPADPFTVEHASLAEYDALIAAEEGKGWPADG